MKVKLNEHYNSPSYSHLY